MTAATSASYPLLTSPLKRAKHLTSFFVGSLFIAALSTPASADYFVVVGSFLDQDVATAEMHRRSDRSGNTLRIAVTDLGDQTFYRLISGPFVNPRTALAEQLGWQSVGVSDAWVVRLNGIPARRSRSHMDLARN